MKHERGTLCFQKNALFQHLLKSINFTEPNTMETELEIWKSRAQAHEENYLHMLERVDEVVAERDEAIRSCHIWQKGHSDIVSERDLWQQEAKRWRDMYLEYDEMLEGQISDAVERLNVVWQDLDNLKKKVQDDLLD